MINILSSNATKANKLFARAPRNKNQDNVEWLAKNMPESDEQIVLVMLGGTSTTDFRLRIAQSHLRRDLKPSHWSHVVLVERAAKRLALSRTVEIPLEFSQGYTFPAETNGVQTGRLGHYADVERYPNVAVLSVPVPSKEVLDSLTRFKMQRAVLDAVELTIRWLAFAWGVSNSGNPLLEGYGMPSAAMLEVLVGAAGYDLTPGLESRSSCPEAIWQAAKWWHEYYQGQQRTPLTGAFFIDHDLGKIASR